MSGDYSNGDFGGGGGGGGSLGNDTNTGSPNSPIQGAGAVSGGGPHGNALSNRITSVLSRSYADHEIKEALSILDARGVVNNAKTRRALRLDAQKEVVECNGAIVMDFGVVAEQLKRVGTMITDLNRTWDGMRKEILRAQRESAPMLEEASVLTAERKVIETKQRLLGAFQHRFVVSEEDLTTLTSSTEPVDDRFFHILNRVKQIRKDCEVLLGSEHQGLGMELMEQTSDNLNAAFKKLYNWIQREFRTLDLENPQIRPSIRRALRVLAERPALFHTCLDFFAQAREKALSDAFHMALTKSLGGVSATTTRPDNTIESQNHDLLRYLGDVFAWVHSTTVSEREALEGLFISDGDQIAKEIQAARDSEPWSRVKDEEENGPGDAAMAFDGQKALNELVNRDMEGVGRLLRQRLGIVVQSNDDPVLVYKAMNLFKFYRAIFSKLVGTPSTLGDHIAELQKSTFSHFEQLLQDETSAVAHEDIPEDLSPPPTLLGALKRFKTFADAGSDVSEPELSQLLSAALVPYLEQCSETASGAPDLTSQYIFQLNYLFTVDTALRPLLPPKHSFLVAVHKKADELRRGLVDSQHSFLLRESGVEQLVNGIQEAGANGSSPVDIASLPVFNPEALATSAAQLDDFLPSAMMDMLENTERLTDKSLGKDIARVAAERFCADFEKVEEAILRVDDESYCAGLTQEDEGNGEEPLLLANVYPRTTAEIRVLLS